jgi:F-type H+-transporting ATPase subunit b
MKIDWFTILAQGVNFLVLVWLMKRFLYKPILHALDEREKKIAAKLSDAEKKMSDAEKEREELKNKIKKFDEERTALMSQATAEVKTEKDRLLGEAKKTIEESNLKRQEALNREKKNLNESILHQTQQEVLATARKILKDLTNVSLEVQTVAIFIERLRQLNQDKKKLLSTAIKSSSDPVVIRTSFEIPEAQSAAVQNVIKELFGEKIEIQFLTSPDLIGGIELNSNGQKVAWSISDYLSVFEEGVDELLTKSEKNVAIAVPQSQNSQPVREVNSNGAS